MVNNKWRKVKLALRLNTCLYVPKSQDESSSSLNNDVDSVGRRFSDVVALSPTASQPATPTPSSSGLRLPKSSPKSSKRTCAICLTAMKPGQGHAIFTAECSHSFHFHCITSNVRHGNRICPICRANWKEVPFENPSSELSTGRSRNNLLGLPGDDAWRATLLRRLPSQPDPNRPVSLPYYTSEPAVFDDDEVCDHQHDAPGRSVDTKDASDDHSVGTVEVTTYPETSSVSRGTAVENFAVLIHLKAPFVSERQSSESQNKLPPTSPNCRASIDLVTVLDGSGSMGGTKLALLKRAMGFVIQNLGPSDRLSVIAFSSTARRIFPLRLMTETGKQEALQAVNSLKSNGGTNIAEGLRKGAKVIVDRKWKNPVASIILLSDGQDTYTVPVSSGGINLRADYISLLPTASTDRNNGSGPQIPVHAFGFGVDHDAASMHSISEISGGTFSFIECEGVIQDAFAQCIGGLLSVVVQELSVSIECIHPGLEISSIKAGSYRTRTEVDSRKGCIDVGDLYAEEERDFLITTNIPSVGSTDDMKLLKVQYSYKDPITKHLVTLEEPVEVKIQRPEVAAGKTVVSTEVDRQRNRLAAAEAMAAARVAAERGDLGDAVAVLDICRKTLSESISALSGDQLCVSLCAELREMQERMANRRVYEASGRAYVLSGLSSHSWQRATARGDSTETTSLVHAYQTPSMVDMVTRSQTMIFGNPSQQRKLRQAQSFPARPRPR